MIRYCYLGEFVNHPDDEHDDEAESGYYEHTDMVQDRMSDEGPL